MQAKIYPQFSSAFSPLNSQSQVQLSRLLHIKSLNHSSSKIEPEKNNKVKINYQDGQFSIVPNFNVFKQIVQRIQHAK